MFSLRRLAFSYRQMASIAPDVFETSVTFKNSQGESINLNAVYQDTLPSGSSIGTVIGLHGAPGSHNDFKYISPLLAKKSIRFIGVNYPGFGHTPGHELLKFNNVERHDFVSSLITQLDLQKNLVVLGHSRGTENAIMLASEGKIYGIVLLNPTGLRMHRGIKPYWFIQACNRLYNTPIPGLKTLLHPLFFQLYKVVKLKVSDGQLAAHCLQTMENVALGEQKRYIELVNGNQTKVLFCYAGKDWLIEDEISRDCAKAFNIDHHHSQTTDKKEEEELLDKTAASFQNKGCSVYFEADGHFLQKARADFVANAIEKMFKMLSRNSLSLTRTLCSAIVDREAMLYAKRLTYKGGKGDDITVDAIYQDTHPRGGGRATVLAQHGSPGTHNDFKYVTPALRDKDIRVVSINYPGHGFTQNDRRLTWENHERNNFTRTLMHSLELFGKKNLVFLGHSRGGENSLQLAVEYIDDCVGVIMLNCPGLRMHRGIRPYWPLEMVMKITSIDFMKPLMYPITGFMYNKVLGLKCSSGEVAATSMLPLRTFAFQGLKPLAEVVSIHPTVRLMYGFSGSDFLIERENSEELAQCFQGRRHVECHTKKDPIDDLRIRTEIKAHFQEGGRILTAFFAKEDHFLQKHRASSIVDAIDAMISNHEKSSQ